MEYRKEPKTGTIYNSETVISRYIQEMPDAGAIIAMFMTWELVDVRYDSKVDTMLHIKRVAQLLTEAAGELIRRANVHDASKLQSPEKEFFDEYTPKLAASTYGSEEYKGFLKELKIGLDHHYANNSHHPEHYTNGLNGFDLFDLIECFLDWKAATERHNDGDIFKSIELNKTRFQYSQQLADIFTNTAERLGYNKPKKA